MQRQGFDIPLLIGGATTSRAHTAIKIAPHYAQPVVYVPDASRAVGVVTKLLSDDQAEGYKAEIAADYEKVRAQHANKKGVTLVKLDEARANSLKLQYAPVAPRQPGRHVLDNIDLATLASYIDWGPFFQTWDLAGSFPKILDDEIVGETARNVFADAQKLLKQVIAEKWITAKAVFGLYPANRIGDDIVLYADETRSNTLMAWHGLRQQHERPEGKAHECLTDFVAPSGTPDWVGMFAVCADGIEAKLKEFEAAHDDYHAIMLKAIADRFAEATAEWLHERVRKDYWGYAADEALSNEALVKEEYKGIRPAPGYPACPDHTAKGDLFRVLDAKAQIGMDLTESFAMLPAAAVSGFYLAHPEAHYFAVSKIGRDQLEDWAKRTGMELAQAERWLAPIL
jgi:5-methyltetrahydrofolate--homocysteine methyltransferase